MNIGCQGPAPPTRGKLLEILASTEREGSGDEGPRVLTPPRKLESKNFCALTSAIHQKKHIASSFSAVCDIKYVPGAREEIFHFKVFQILKFGLFFEGF